ncbi:3-deoxy-D-manno-octulosonic acid transferase [Falsirhodobacter xinxiangensis]|uniref:3-deoxy-D-manno-octulosonic acid transferase n=1 Tax=Falsirhodobacter xinxiangensis TaxID=2530049 RepID=UPI0010AB1E41|nr:glycosyltransferase N-terminal domain-containing protein [Rhodobacter xinxiangensis]
MILYRLVLLFALPFLCLHAWRRGALRDRLALGPAIPGAIWVHGASNGEITSARRVIEALAARGDAVLVTCNNPTAKAMVEGWNIGVTARLAPFDDLLTVRRFLRRWQPRALVVIENELWPERIIAAARRMPVLAIGARMSERSARRWQKVPLMRRMLGAPSWVSAQDAQSEARLVALGLPADRLGPRLMLKTAEAAMATPGPVPRVETLLAASTHEGEDAPILAAFAAQSRFRWLILAPRHPKRGPQIAQLARAMGLDVRLRSAGDAPGGQVYIADTLGEMATWYGMAGATFIGATFVEKGGHTPFEPVAAGSAVLHGPSLFNFTEVFAALNDAVLPVTPETLAAALDTLTPTRQRQLADAARAALPRSDVTPAIEALDRLIQRIAR